MYYTVLDIVGNLDGHISYLTTNKLLITMQGHA